MAMPCSIETKLRFFFLFSFRSFFFPLICSSQSNYSSPWHWTTVTATGEWHTEARKEPNSTADLASFLPSNSDFHNFHHLMSAGGNLNLGGHKHRVNNSGTKQGLPSLPLPPPPPMPSSIGHSVAHQSVMPISPSISTSMMPNAGPIALPPPAPTSLPSKHAATSNTNAMLSPRHLPFPYNINNFHHTGY